jgi:hypothetical protein
MFGSQILDTAIGIAFIFVLVSSLVTIGNELIASILGSRAAWLAVGVERLLGHDMAAALYAHPLIGGAQADPAAAGTAAGEVRRPRLAGLGAASARRWRREGSAQPSYIASRTFANVLLDLVHQRTQVLQAARTALEQLCGIPGSASDLAEFSGKARATADDLAAGGCPAVAAALRRLLLQMPAGGSLEDARMAILRFSDALAAHGLHDAIAALPDRKVGKILLLLLGDAGGDLEKFKENVEIWFNNAMDRVAGWYKRRSQWVAFALGVAVAVVMNIDSLAVIHFLQTSPGARDALVTQSKAYAGVQDAAPADPAALPRQFESIQSRLLQLDLPIAWVRGVNAKESDRRGFNVIPDSGAAAADTALFHALGWLVTALAATLGAPFWFDMLNRIVAVRSTGKAPEEKPKPPKLVQLPLEPGESPKEAERADAARP